MFVFRKSGPLPWEFLWPNPCVLPTDHSEKDHLAACVLALWFTQLKWDSLTKHLSVASSLNGFFIPSTILTSQILLSFMYFSSDLELFYRFSKFLPLPSRALSAFSLRPSPLCPPQTLLAGSPFNSLSLMLQPLRLTKISHLLTATRRGMNWFLSHLQKSRGENFANQLKWQIACLLKMRFIPKGSQSWRLQEISEPYFEQGKHFFRLFPA